MPASKSKWSRLFRDLYTLPFFHLMKILEFFSEKEGNFKRVLNNKDDPKSFEVVKEWK